MKKIISLVLTLTMCLTLAFALASCELVHPIQKFLVNMQTEKSYKITATINDVAGLGDLVTLSIVTSVDGNVQHIDGGVLLGEAYLEEADGVTYGYYKSFSGKWEKEALDVEDLEVDLQNMFGPELIFAIFNPDNYDEVEGEEKTYKQKADVTFEVFDGVEVKDVVIVVGEETCSVSLKVSVEGYDVSAELVISDVGSTNVELPIVD